MTLVKKITAIEEYLLKYTIPKANKGSLYFEIWEKQY